MITYDFETKLDERLAAIEENPNGDDIPFLIECVRYWKRLFEAAEDNAMERGTLE